MDLRAKAKAIEWIYKKYGRFIVNHGPVRKNVLAHKNICCGSGCSRIAITGCFFLEGICYSNIVYIHKHLEQTIIVRVWEGKTSLLIYKHRSYINWYE